MIDDPASLPPSRRDATPLFVVVGCAVALGAVIGWGYGVGGFLMGVAWFRWASTLARRAALLLVASSAAAGWLLAVSLERPGPQVDLEPPLRFELTGAQLTADGRWLGTCLRYEDGRRRLAIQRVSLMEGGMRGPEERVREVPGPAAWAVGQGGRALITGLDRVPAGVAIAAAGEGAAVIDADGRLRATRDGSWETMAIDAQIELGGLAPLRWRLAADAERVLVVGDGERGSLIALWSLRSGERLARRVEAEPVLGFALGARWFAYSSDQRLSLVPIGGGAPVQRPIAGAQRIAFHRDRVVCSLATRQQVLFDAPSGPLERRLDGRSDDEQRPLLALCLADEATSFLLLPNGALLRSAGSDGPDSYGAIWQPHDRWRGQPVLTDGIRPPSADAERQLEAERWAWRTALGVYLALVVACLLQRLLEGWPELWVPWQAPWAALLVFIGLLLVVPSGHGPSLPLVLMLGLACVYVHVGLTTALLDRWRPWHWHWLMAIAAPALLLSLS